MLLYIKLFFFCNGYCFLDKYETLIDYIYFKKNFKYFDRSQILSQALESLVGHTDTYIIAIHKCLY